MQLHSSLYCDHIFGHLCWNLLDLYTLWWSYDGIVVLAATSSSFLYYTVKTLDDVGSATEPESFEFTSVHYYVTETSQDVSFLHHAKLHFNKSWFRNQFDLAVKCSLMVQRYSWKVHLLHTTLQDRRSRKSRSISLEIESMKEIPGSEQTGGPSESHKSETSHE